MNDTYKRENTVNRLLSVLTAIAATSVLLVAAPASAAASTGSATTTAGPGGGGIGEELTWKRYRRFENAMLCEGMGAAGVMAGRWSQWRCDDQNVLWVNTSETDPLG